MAARVAQERDWNLGTIFWLSNRFGFAFLNLFKQNFD
jgi:hypothetical protein